MLGAPSALLFSTAYLTAWTVARVARGSVYTDGPATAEAATAEAEETLAVGSGLAKLAAMFPAR